MAIDEADIRLDLLKSELSSLESGIRAFDSISFQVKGWCVTATVALTGFAVSGHKRLLLVAVFAVIGFWLVDSQNRQIQRAFLQRNGQLRRTLASDVTTPLQPGTPILSSGVPSVVIDLTPPGSSTFKRLISYTRSVLHEGLLAHTLGLYLFLLVALGVSAVLALVF